MVNRTARWFVSIALLSSSCHTVGGGPVRIVATDAGLEAPATMRAGLRHIVFENHGAEIHEAMLVRLPAGMDAERFAALVNDGVLFPEGAQDYSGPGLLAGGEAMELWLTLDPGDYVLICWHHMRDPVRGFSVPAGAREDDVPPKEDAVLSLRDFRFELSGALRAGERVIKVEAHGPTIHEADIFRLQPGRTAGDVQRWYKDDLGGAPPADALGGVLDSHDTGRVVWLRRNFTPGRYVLHCGIPLDQQAKSGESSGLHDDAGMVLTFDIDP